ncbi:right-handed parallel beta-helix repeat-containing protein [Novipirellula rosea]|uniref:Right handed beta helix domain-containing protein n=2 Tax=Novipirellula TaxID=2795426 RepID=A0ABP8N2P8_9BACT
MNFSRMNDAILRATSCGSATLALLMCLSSSVATADNRFSVADYETIQAALDANRGRLVFVPPGDYHISEKLRVRGAGSGLFGPGRIIQTQANQPVIEIENAEGAAIRDLTVTRSEGNRETNNEGILAIDCRDLVIENVSVIDNRTRSAAITLRDCIDSRITHCLIKNYMRITVDDRTASADWGYAFNCTDGTGISVSQSVGTLIESNRVIEENLVPTREIQAKHHLGDFVRKNKQKGIIVNQTMWDAGYTDNWQQGSGIIVTSPETSDLTRIINNHIENAAQGIDLHCDHVTVANNVIVNSFVGMKAMHGSRNVIIIGNQFTRNSLWAIGLMPGAAANASNTDGGSIIANNIISDFGHGDAHWIWGNERSPLKFDSGQQADDPPLTNVIIQGNIVDCIGPARFEYAVIIAQGENMPKGLRFSNNLFHPGTAGVANTELAP